MMNSTTQDLLLHQGYIRYRNWLISSKHIAGKLWLRWQHPHDEFPRYSCPVGEKGLEEALKFVRSLINITIELEEDKN